MAGGCLSLHKFRNGYWGYDPCFSMSVRPDWSADMEGRPRVFLRDSQKEVMTYTESWYYTVQGTCSLYIAL